MFHHFHDSFHPVGQGSISGETMDEVLNYLKKRHRVLPATEWLEKTLAGKIAENEICLTFDDALRCQADIALPVLEAHGLTAFWFVYSSVFEGHVELFEVFRYFRSVRFESFAAFGSAFFDFAATSRYAEKVRTGLREFDPRNYLREYSFYTDEDRRFRFARDRILGPRDYRDLMTEMMASFGMSPESAMQRLWLDDRSLRDLANRGNIVGLHSYSHPTRIEELSRETKRSEYERNSRHLASVLGDRPITMSHPCNSYDDEILEILAGLGVRIGFRSNMAPARRSALEIPRRDHAEILLEMGR